MVFNGENEPFLNKNKLKNMIDFYSIILYIRNI